jgi:hypothetical protein
MRDLGMTPLPETGNNLHSLLDWVPGNGFWEACVGLRDGEVDEAASSSSAEDASSSCCCSGSSGGGGSRNKSSRNVLAIAPSRERNQIHPLDLET